MPQSPVLSGFACASFRVIQVRAGARARGNHAGLCIEAQKLFVCWKTGGTLRKLVPFRVVPRYLFLRSPLCVAGGPVCFPISGVLSLWSRATRYGGPFALRVGC